jgi:glycosyltransferase involved in cell wall biosynthesis
MPPIELSIVIPVYNERSTIEEILACVEAVDIPKEIVIVEDGSQDGTREFLAELSEQYRRAGRDDIRIVFQPRNCGKGAALRRGFQEAQGEIVVIQDADLEYDPENFHALIDPIRKGKADVVYGSRFLGGPHRVLFYWHYVGNKFLTILSNMFTDLNLSDVWTCHKAFRREVLQQLDLREDRFGFEQEITCKVAAHGWRMFEIPISYYGRTYDEGKKITWKDGIRGFWCVLRYSSRPGRNAHAASSDVRRRPVLVEPQAAAATPRKEAARAGRG